MFIVFQIYFIFVLVQASTCTHTHTYTRAYTHTIILSVLYIFIKYIVYTSTRKLHVLIFIYGNKFKCIIQVLCIHVFEYIFTFHFLFLYT